MFQLSFISFAFMTLLACSASALSAPASQTEAAVGALAQARQNLGQAAERQDRHGAMLALQDMLGAVHELRQTPTFQNETILFEAHRHIEQAMTAVPKADQPELRGKAVSEALNAAMEATGRLLESAQQAAAARNTYRP